MLGFVWHQLDDRNASDQADEVRRPFYPHFLRIELNCVPGAELKAELCAAARMYEGFAEELEKPARLTATDQALSTQGFAPRTTIPRSTEVTECVFDSRVSDRRRKLCDAPCHFAVSFCCG